jgi:glutamate racemase
MVPVIGIVELGVEMIAERLLRDPASTAVVFGTETTIGEKSHKLQLMARGIDSSRIAVEACPGLAGEIQTDPASDIVRSYIGMFVDEAVSTIKRSHTIIAALCCTHYGYCSAQFAAAFAGEGYQAEILNPNERMAALLFAPERDARFLLSRVSVRVVSRVVLSEQERAAIGALIRQEAPLTADALAQYQRLADLF